jgi:hypothetical protein
VVFTPHHHITISHVRKYNNTGFTPIDFLVLQQYNNIGFTPIDSLAMHHVGALVLQQYNNTGFTPIDKPGSHHYVSKHSLRPGYVSECLLRMPHGETVCHIAA